MNAILWKIYAFIFCCVQLVNIFDSRHDLYGIAISIWSLVGIFALLGYIYKTPVGWLIVWKIYFGLVIFVACAFLGFISIGLVNNPSNEGIFYFVLVYLVQIPYWYAIWAYAYKSHKIWAKKLNER